MGVGAAAIFALESFVDLVNHASRSESMSEFAQPTTGGPDIVCDYMTVLRKPGKV